MLKKNSIVNIKKEKFCHKSYKKKRKNYYNYSELRFMHLV